jgi:hypothetical protein
VTIRVRGILINLKGATDSDESYSESAPLIAFTPVCESPSHFSNVFFVAMVTLSAIRHSNAAFKASNKSLTALFVGGTSGVGKGTLIELTKNSPSPTIYIVGRSEKSVTPFLEELRQLNSKGKYVFIETECSLIRNVDEVCESIEKTEKGLDLLFLSAGYLSVDGRNGSPCSNFRY